MITNDELGGGVCTKKIQICEASQSDLEKSMHKFTKNNKSSRYDDVL